MFLATFALTLIDTPLDNHHRHHFVCPFRSSVCHSLSTLQINNRFTPRTHIEMENTIKFITLLNRERECGIFRSMAEIYFMQNKEIVLRVAHVDHDWWSLDQRIFPSIHIRTKSNQIIIYFQQLFEQISWFRTNNIYNSLVCHTNLAVGDA